MISLDPTKYHSKKIVNLEELSKRLESERGEKTVGLCAGCFDLLHPGHITHLISAKNFCDILVVAVSRDHFSKTKYPGKSEKPIYSQDIRAFMVANLACVDYVTLDDGNEETFKIIRPNFFIKGSNYFQEVDEKRLEYQRLLLSSIGAEIRITPDEKLSTSDIINYIKSMGK